MSAWRGLCSLGLGGTAAVLLLTLSPAMVRADGITTFSCTVNGQSNTITTTSSTAYSWSSQLEVGWVSLGIQAVGLVA